MAQRYDIWTYYDKMVTYKDDNGDWVKYDDHAAEITQLRAEIERLKQGAIELATMLNEVASAQIRAAEAERDKARAEINEYRGAAMQAAIELDEALVQVAMSFEAAAGILVKARAYWGESVSAKNAESEIRALTPADAKAALEARDRKKMWEGMHLAATIAGQKSAVLPHHPDIIRGYAQGRSGARDAILAEMETVMK